MSYIPDFVLNLQEIQRTVGEQAAVTEELWRDCVKEDFYYKYVEPFDHVINVVIHGQDGMDSIYERSLNDLLVFISDRIVEMAEIAECSPDEIFQQAYYQGDHGSLSDDELMLKDNEGRLMNPMDHWRVRERGGIVHDDRLTRDYWDTFSHGPRPGELDKEDIDKIMERREL